MIHRSVNKFEETHDKLAFNDFDESHDTNDTLDMQAFVSFHFLQCDKRKCSNTWVGRTCASFRSISILSPSPLIANLKVSAAAQNDLDK